MRHVYCNYCLEGGQNGALYNQVRAILEQPPSTTEFHLNPNVFSYPSSTTK